MSLYFQSICSSSSGNALALWTDTTRLLIDCGLASMKRTRQALAAVYPDGRLDSVLLTHPHSDHISHYPLRVMDELGLTVRLLGDGVGPLRRQHFRDCAFKNLRLEPFDTDPFTIGDLLIRPFTLDHYPGLATCGFEIFYGDYKTVIATDFFNWTSAFERFRDADFLFIESNHDLDLLRRYFNPNSRYHLPNPQTAQLLLNVRRESRRAPQRVILGHLSNQRNRPDLALRETQTAFKKAAVPLDFDLSTAPLRTPGSAIRLA